MKQEYIDYAGKYVQAKALKGEVEALLFYRKLIIKLMIILVMVNLSSLSLLLFAHDLFMYFTLGNKSSLTVLFYGGVFFITMGILIYNLREEMFVRDTLKKVYQLINIIPST